MPLGKISHMTGMGKHINEGHKACDFDPNPHKFGGMSDEDMREFMKEEQREGVHPSLRGKRF